MTRMLLLAALLGTPTQIAFAQEAGECPATAPSMVDSLVRAEKAFSQKDTATFTEHRDAARRKLECLTEILAPREAALYHRVQAYGYYLADEKVDALAGLRAARKIDPAFKMWRGFGPDAGVYELWEEAGKSTIAGASTIPVSGPGDALVYVDGRRALARPDKLPTLLQLVSLHGGVKSNRYVRIGAEGPSWAHSATPEATADSEETPPGVVPTAGGSDGPVTKAEAGVATSSSGVAVATRERGKVELQKKGPRFGKPTAPLLLASGAAFVATGFLASTAGTVQDEFNEPWHPFEYRETLQKRANNLGYAAQGTGVIGAGLLVGAALTIDW